MDLPTFKSICSDQEFPIDTVKQIHNDIEKLFSEDNQEDSSFESVHTNSMPQMSENSFLAEGIESKMLNQSAESRYQTSSFNLILNGLMMINADESYLNLTDSLQLCLYELENLDNELQMSCSTANNACPWTQYQLDQMPMFVWNLLSLHEKLCSIFQVGYEEQQGDVRRVSPAMSSDASRLISHWYAIVELIKSAVTNCEPIVRNYSISINLGLKLYLQHFWKATRQLRTLHWVLLMQSLSD